MKNAGHPMDARHSKSTCIIFRQFVSSSTNKEVRSMAAKTEKIGGIMHQGPIVPWLYLLPALLVMTTFIVYPGLNTFYLSFRNNTNTGWASENCIASEPCWGVFENYRYALTSDIMRTAFINNLTWILVMVSGTVVLGLLIATLADRVRYEAIAKALIFLPMAISFVGAGVIWKFVYNYGTGPVQIGLLNAFLVSLGFEPVSWLTEPQINTIALIVVGVWKRRGWMEPANGPYSGKSLSPRSCPPSRWSSPPW
jgi:alpha-glucoside transport system permease protein